LEKALGLLERGFAVLVDVDVVVEMPLERSWIAALLAYFLECVLDAKFEVLRIPGGGLPAVRVPRTAAVSSLDQGEVARCPRGERFLLAGIVRYPDWRTRLSGRLRLDSHARASIVLAFEGDIVL